MNAPARIKRGSARIHYRGRDQFVARLPHHRSAVWKRPSTVARVRAAVFGGPLKRRELLFVFCFVAPVGTALLAAALVLLP